MYKQLTYNNSVLQYQCIGNGPAVVLLHGFAEDSSVWGFQKVLAQQFQLLIPDLPGSGTAASIADMSMEGLADAVRYLLQQEGIEMCTMIGHSMGGYVALAFAEKWEAMLNGLGLFHSTAYADSDEKRATRKKGIAFMNEHGAFNFLKTATPNLYSFTTKELKPSLIEQQLNASRHFSKEALIAYYEAMMQRPDRTHILRFTPLPVLFVMGRWDTAVPMQDALAQCHIPQLAYIHVLDHSGHMGMVEEPEASSALLKQFLSETVVMV